MFTIENLDLVSASLNEMRTLLDHAIEKYDDAKSALAEVSSEITDPTEPLDKYMAGRVRTIEKFLDPLIVMGGRAGAVFDLLDQVDKSLVNKYKQP